MKFVVCCVWCSVYVNSECWDLNGVNRTEVLYGTDYEWHFKVGLKVKMGRMLTTPLSYSNVWCMGMSCIANPNHPRVELTCTHLCLELTYCTPTCQWNLNVSDTAAAFTQGNLFGRYHKKMGDIELQSFWRCFYWCTMCVLLENNVACRIVCCNSLLDHSLWHLKQNNFSWVLQC